MKKSIAFAIALSFCLTTSSLSFSKKISTQIKKPKIVWFSNLSEDEALHNGFWKLARTFMQATAEDLKVDFKIYYSDYNHLMMSKQAKEILGTPTNRPHGIILHNFKRNGSKIIKLADPAGVKAILFNTGFKPDEKMGKPREKYKNWLAQLKPDDEYAGKLLAEKLFEESLKLDSVHPNQKVMVVGFQGREISSGAIDRQKGFELALEGNKQFVLKQYLRASWKRDLAKKMFPRIHSRHKDVKVFWAANDNMALGIIDSAHELGLKPGKDFVVGGVDWLNESVESLQNNEMSVTVGGHFIEGFIALIMMYDYLKGYDFAKSDGVIQKTKMFGLTTSNIDKYGNLSKKFTFKNARKVDFKQFSKAHNKRLKKYDFDLNKILEQL